MVGTPARGVSGGRRLQVLRRLHRGVPDRFDPRPAERLREAQEQEGRPGPLQGDLPGGHRHPPVRAVRQSKVKKAPPPRWCGRRSPSRARSGTCATTPANPIAAAGEVNEAVAIRRIKRYAAEHDDGAWKQKGYRKAPTGKRVAVVGAGPAGLTAAYYLAKSGHQVTVFERLERPGGMLRVGIPTYRLPREVLDEEIAHIESAGVEIRCGAEIASVDALKAAGLRRRARRGGRPSGREAPHPGQGPGRGAAQHGVPEAGQSGRGRSRWENGWWCWAEATWPSTAPASRRGWGRRRSVWPAWSRGTRCGPARRRSAEALEGGRDSLQRLHLRRDRRGRRQGRRRPLPEGQLLHVRRRRGAHHLRGGGFGTGTAGRHRDLRRGAAAGSRPMASA